MKYIFTLFLLLAIIFIVSNCKSNSSGPSSCMENPDSNGKLLVIVGEKISIKEEDQPPIPPLTLPYAKFTAHYRILEKVCGDYQQDTISFTAYDHYGFPPFGNYEHSLLYLSVTKEGIFHEIYLFSPLYKTTDNRWASPYSRSDYDRGYKGITIKPEKIDFVKEISFNIDGFTRTKTQNSYPEPFYRIDKVNKKAIVVMGNYVSELFQLQKETVLHARGIYGKPDSISFKPPELKIAEYIKLSKKDSLELLKTWSTLLKAIKANDSLAVRNISLDSIICSVCEGMPRDYYENNLESIQMFIDSALVNFQKSELWPLLQKNKYEIDVVKWSPDKLDYFSVKNNDSLPIFTIRFLKGLKTSYYIRRQHHDFQFLKIDNRFLFYKMESR